jgi:hypothetical protein
MFTPVPVHENAVTDSQGDILIVTLHNTTPEGVMNKLDIFKEQVFYLSLDRVKLQKIMLSANFFTACFKQLITAGINKLLIPQSRVILCFTFVFLNFCPIMNSSFPFVSYLLTRRYVNP